MTRVTIIRVRFPDLLVGKSVSRFLTKTYHGTRDNVDVHHVQQILKIEQNEVKFCENYRIAFCISGDVQVQCSGKDLRSTSREISRK